MKYLYPYECDKLKLSNPGELQAAIDGNRREGRRPGYGYDFSPLPTMIPPSPHHLGGGLLNGRPPLPNHGELKCLISDCAIRDRNVAVFWFISD